MTPLLAVVGPTASGKTSLGVELGAAVGGELINIDSMQVFRGLDVGTDKPTPAQRSRVPFHLVDVLEPGELFDAATCARLGGAAAEAIWARGRIPIAAGGTGLYHRALRHGLIDAPPRDDAFRAGLRARREAEGIEALYAELDRLDPDAAAAIKPTDWVRIERALEVQHLTGATISSAHAQHGFGPERFRCWTIGCFRPREELYAGIESRLEQMWTSGLLDETRALLDRGFSLDVLPLKALGYRHAALFLRGELGRDEALALAKRDTKRFAKRQLTWFRADRSVCWLRVPLEQAALQRLAAAVRDFTAGAEPRTLELPTVDAV